MVTHSLNLVRTLPLTLSHRTVSWKTMSLRRSIPTALCLDSLCLATSSSSSENKSSSRDSVRIGLLSANWLLVYRDYKYSAKEASGIMLPPSIFDLKAIIRRWPWLKDSWRLTHLKKYFGMYLRRRSMTLFTLGVCSSLWRGVRFLRARIPVSSLM